MFVVVFHFPLPCSISSLLPPHLRPPQLSPRPLALTVSPALPAASSHSFLTSLPCSAALSARTCSDSIFYSPRYPCSPLTLRRSTPTAPPLSQPSLRTARDLQPPLRRPRSSPSLLMIRPRSSTRPPIARSLSAPADLLSHCLRPPTRLASRCSYLRPSVAHLRCRSRLLLLLRSVFRGRRVRSPPSASSPPRLRRAPRVPPAPAPGRFAAATPLAAAGSITAPSTRPTPPHRAPLPPSRTPSRSTPVSRAPRCRPSLPLSASTFPGH